MRPQETLDARFWARVEQQGDCWVWTGPKVGMGYGRFSIGRGKLAVAHRWAWEQRNGPIPDGLQLDHLCKNPPCVNPDHLDPVTALVNSRRSSRYGDHPTHCKRGHEFTPENSVPTTGGIKCRRCLNEWKKARRVSDREAMTPEELQAFKARKSAQDKAYYRREKPPLAADDPRHGKASTYNGLGCRCRLCTDAVTAAARQRREGAR